MRENRTCGSEGGEAQSLPYPYPARSRRLSAGWKAGAPNYVLVRLVVLAG